MISTALRFYVILILLMVSLFCTHLLVIDQFGYLVPDGLLLICYVFNIIIAGVLFLFFLFLSKNQPSILGLGLLITSGFKFLLFFTLIYPNFQSQAPESKLDFLTFFIPYVAALSLEIYQLAKILNQEE